MINNMLTLRQFYMQNHKSIKRFIFEHYQLPNHIMLYIFDFIDEYKYIYDNVMFDIDMGIHTTQVFYSIDSSTLPKLTAFKMPNNLKQYIVAYKDIYIPLSSILQMHDEDIDHVSTEQLIITFNKMYNEGQLEQHKYYELLKNKLNKSIITISDYNRLKQLYNDKYNLNSRQSHLLQYVSLTERYTQHISMFDNLIDRSHSDPQVICNICDKRFNISDSLKQASMLSISEDMKEPYSICACENKIS